jgi:hypothetical protein
VFAPLGPYGNHGPQAFHLSGRGVRIYFLTVGNVAPVNEWIGRSSLQSLTGAPIEAAMGYPI